MPVTIGATGRAVTPLRPTGFVTINGARLEAKLAPSAAAVVESGTDVVVVGADAFGVLVRPSAEIISIANLPGYGESAPTPAELGELRDEAEKQIWEDEQEETERSLQKETMVFAIPLLAAFALGITLFGWEAAVALSAAWVVIFFGIGLLSMAFGEG